VEFQHFVLMPFYVRRVFGTGLNPLPPLEWLEDRMMLFERYCLPSIAAQSCQAFKVICFFDSETPTEALDRFRAAIADCPNIHLKLLSSWTHQASAEAAREIAEPGFTWSLTTRLDNDDGWHERFVETLQGQVHVGSRELLNFTRGYIVSGGRTYLYKHLSNAFISFSEPAGEMVTPFVTGHELLQELAPIRQIDAPPMFYQIVHGDNFSNKVRGTRVPVQKALSGFKTLNFALDGKQSEPVGMLILENATMGTIRFVRDHVINLLKRVRQAVRQAAPSN